MGLLFGEAFPASCTVAVWEDRRAVAVAQMAQQSGRDQWEIMHLVAEGRADGTLDGQQEFGFRVRDLLDEVCRLAGARRMTGVVARVPLEPELVAVFRAAGFTAMTQEDSYARAVAVTTAAPQIHGLRLQETDDAWALHRLYVRSVPPAVRQAEGRTARDWQLRRGPKRLSMRTTRWIVDDPQGVQGWLTETPGRNGALRVQVGVAPGQRELAHDLVATALAHAAAQGRGHVWSRVAAYATDVQQALVDCGFAHTGAAVVLKRSLAVRVRAFAPGASAVRRGARGGLAATESRMLYAQSGGSPAGRAATGRVGNCGN